MAGALAWTLQLVFFVLIVQGVLTLIENIGIPLSRGFGACDMSDSHAD